MRQNIKLSKMHRVLSMVLAIVMVVSMVPLSVIAAGIPSEFKTDIGEKEFTVGVPTEFTFTTVANGDAGTMVKGSAVFSDPDAIEKLEYYEIQDGNWYELNGDFGPATGFPMSDATSKFRVTFNKAGVYTVNAYMKTVEDGSVLCSTQATVAVSGTGSSLTTDISNKVFVVGEDYTEFTFTTWATDDAGKLVRGYFEFSDREALTSLQYYNVNTGTFDEFYGDFGPATGFPMGNDITSRFQAKFNKAGIYTVKAYMQDMDGNILCVRVADVIVKERSELSYTTNSIEIKYSDVNAINNTLENKVEGAEITYKSDNTAVVEVDPDTGILTPVSLGEATITATRKETIGYMGSTATYKVKVIAGDQNALVWDKSVPSSIVWNDPAGYSNTIKTDSGSGNGTVTYESDNLEVAEVDPNTGVLTIKKPGTVKITATKAGGTLYNQQTSSYTLVVTTAEQDKLEFADKNPDAIYYGDDTFANVATGGSIAEGTIKYESSNPAVAEVDENGKITAHKQGTVTITATLAGNDYYEAVSATYNLTVYRANQTPVFSKGTEGQEITYGDTGYANVLTANTSPITYVSSDPTVATVDANGVITTLKAGKVTITATAPQTEQYEEKSLSYELKINLASQIVVFEKGTTGLDALTYGDSFTNIASATTGITYSSSDPTIASVDPVTGVVTTHKSGEVTITATAAETEQYAGASESYKITINKAAQTITFDKGTAPTVTFNDNENKFSNPASSNATKGDEEDKKNIDVLYSIASGSEFVVDGTFNSATGSFEIKGAGTIIVTVSFTTNDRYAANMASYTLVVAKDDQTIAFEKSEYDMINGDKSFTAPTASEQGTLFGTKDIVYTIDKNDDGVVSAIDASTGALTFTNKTGTVVIRATKPADNNYKEVSVTYTLTVKDEEIGQNVFHALIGEKIDAESDWYTGNVSIKAAEGYLLSYYEDVDKADWQETLVDAVATDGTYNITFYVKHVESGKIYAAQTVTIKRDTTDPTAQINHEKLTGWDKFLSIITLGLWEPEEMNFTIASGDDTSGLQKVEYIVVEGTTEVIKDEAEIEKIVASNGGWKRYGSSIPVGKDKIFVVYAKVTDIAGQHIYATTNGIVFDRTKVPVENIVFDLPEDTNGFYNGNVKVDVSITDAQPSSGIQSVTYEVYNKAVSNTVPTQSGTLFTFGVENPEYKDLVPSWNTADNDKSIIVDASKNNSDHIVVKVTVVDNAGNTTTNEVSLKICTVPLTLDVSFVEDPSIINTHEGIDYYDTNRVAKFVITGRTSVFNASAILNPTVDASKADTYEIVSWETAENLENPDAATHTLLVKFNGNATYEFELDDADIFGNKLTYTSDKFVVDHDDPTAKVIIDETDTWTTLIETLTFGLWRNDKFTVKAEAEDTTSPIKSIEYYIHDGEFALTTGQLDQVSWTEYSEFDISEDLRFTIYLKVTDYAGHHKYFSSDGHVLDKEPSAITITPENTELNHGGIPLYNGDVDVLIDVKELTENAYSGIKEVKYWVVKDHSVTTQQEVLYTFDNASPAYADLLETFSETVTIDSTLNNSCDVVLFVGVTDNAGNYKEESVAVDIDITKPTISIEYNNNSALNDKYFGATRTAKVVITERPEHFNATNATAGIVITAHNAKNEEVIDDYATMISSWTTEGTGDTATHTATIAFNKDAKYTLAISYTDLANNANTPVDPGTSVAPFDFVVDTTDPTATVSTMERTWDKLIEVLTFGLWSKDTINVAATATDGTSPVKIEYYKTDSTTKLTSEQLDAVTSWTAFEGLEIDEDEKLVVYLKVTDNAGNYIYISTDGVVVDKTPSAITLTPDETTLEHNGIPLYNKDVNVLIDVKELTDHAYSGIKEVKYWVVKDGTTKTQEAVLYAFDIAAPTYADLKPTFTQTVTIESELNNSCDVVLYVGVTDNAGNYKEEKVAVDIDITKPTIEVTYNNNTAYKTVGNKGYFPGARTATVVITERTAHFSATKATASIQITAKNAAGEPVIADCSTLISTWNSVGTGNEATHTATIDFSADANYTFAISYTDLATNSNEGVDTKNSVTPYDFAVDKTAPTGTVTAGTLGTWDKLIEILTFGLWSKDSVEVTGTSADVTTPIESVSYYKTSDTTAKSVDDLKAITEWADFNGFTVPADEKFVVYVRIVDFAGNTTYISTNGVVVDDDLPAVETVKPEITITPTPVYGIYNSDVTFAVSVVDPKQGETEAYAGLKEIRYEVYNMGAKTQDGVLYSFDITNPTHGELKQSWEKKDAIVVNKDLNNSNDVKVVVYAVDNAGNESKADCDIKIDITQPTISVRYDNNDGDTTFTESTYFKANRTATIVVTERNFDPELVKLVITNTDGYVPTLVGWKTVQGTGNGDNTTHEATVLFDKDGDYTFAISLEDSAKNANTAVDYGTSLAPEKFTVDKTLPTVSVVYDNNDVLNGNYYKAERTATITVTEHNFETGRIVIKLEATDDGAASTLPVVSNWTSNGDVHTATIKYSADSRYVFDFDYKDKAGNATADIAEQVFFVDKTNPAVSISGIVDESANNDEGNIGFVITATDTNFDVFTPVLTAVIKNGDKFETKTLDIAKVTDTKNGKVYTVTNIDADGIYRITCTVVDKAGNAFSSVTLDKADGTTHSVERAGADTLVTFSVNRDGSTFEVDGETVKVVDQYYIQNLKNDVVIVETNADPLKEYTVTLNGKELVKDTDYTVTEEGGDGAWMKYTYTVKKDLFADEGEYKLVVSSKDKAENDAFSDVKDATVEFVVDRTAPVVTVSGLANDGRYQTESQVVTLIPTDDGGALKTVVVKLVDEDGKVIKELVNLSGEALTAALEENGGKITFEVAEGLYQNVQVVCTDEATGDGEDTNTYDVTFKNVSVSSNVFMIFWANKPLRWGTIGGVSALLIGLVVFIVLKKKKRKEA